MNINQTSYGIGESSYRAAGELEGLTKLVDAFYTFMSTLPEADKIRKMHPDNLDESRRKLTYFLSGWLGGPRLYSQHYGSIIIPKAHMHLDIKHEEANAWILCMQKAVEVQPYADDFKIYLIEQLKIPAERIRMACEKSAAL